jgi:hypothetical protein
MRTKITKEGDLETTIYEWYKVRPKTALELISGMKAGNLTAIEYRDKTLKMTYVYRRMA